MLEHGGVDDRGQPTFLPERGDPTHDVASGLLRLVDRRERGVADVGLGQRDPRGGVGRRGGEGVGAAPVERRPVEVDADLEVLAALLDERLRRTRRGSQPTAPVSGSTASP